MIHDIINDIGTTLVNKLPWVVEFKQLARQDVSGTIVKEDGEEWVGIDDRWLGRVYFRLRDGIDSTYNVASISSHPDTSTITKLRAVLMHNCKNEHEILRWMSHTIGVSRNHAMRYKVVLINGSTDKQYIVQQETKKSGGIPDDHMRLVMVDFDVIYKDALDLNNNCPPDCNEC